ncbi:MAG TPA: contractile injection system protein, VgrG/Pvc8 family [Aquabacterium sp.]|nr:contractile injection system protein, VgrG/Pvc8 family [Aquabacterium sp.]
MPETTERPVSSLPAYSARPTVRIDGQPLATVDQQLRTMTVSEAEGGLASLVLRLGNWGSIGDQVDHLFDAGGPVGLGSRIEVYAGDASGPRKLFDGEVHALEGVYSIGGAPELVLLAEDGLFAARQARRSALHESRTLEQLARDIASRHGLTLDASGLPATPGLWTQVDESDLAFLRRTAARLDCDFQLVDSTLQLRRCADRDRGTIELAMYSQLLALRVIADLADQVSEISVGGFDVARGRACAATSRGAQRGPGSGLTGTQLLGRLRRGNRRSEHLGALPCASQAEAQALADTAFDQRARRFVRAHGQAEGNAALRVGSRVRLRGTGQRFDNTYAVVEARHRFDTVSGYRTDFVGECAYLAG